MWRAPNSAGDGVEKRREWVGVAGYTDEKLGSKNWDKRKTFFPETSRRAAELDLLQGQVSS